MVHALEEIHRLLKSTGVLIEMHPIAEFPTLEIHQGGKIVLAGDLTARQWISDYQHVDGALAEVIQRGLYVVERERVYDHLTTIDTDEEIKMIMSESIDEGTSVAKAPGDKNLAAQVDDLLYAADSGVEMSMHEWIHISLMRPA